jgi:SAM-dependent methyltransferase
MIAEASCPLCGTKQTNELVQGPDERHYYLCGCCQLIVAAPGSFLSIPEEEAVYLQHENSIQNEGYVTFLKRAIQPALPWLQTGMHGLDYGCGPGPTLATLMQQAGMPCDNWDPIFFPELDSTKTYDYIFATECFEHFYHPAQELDKLLSLLKKGGILTVMTQLRPEAALFKNWYYPRDPTHVSFYAPHTFTWICEAYALEKLYSDGKRVLVFRKK